MKYLFLFLMFIFIISLLSYLKNQQIIKDHRDKLNNGIYLKEWEKRNNISYQEYVSKGGGTHFIESHTHYNARR